jgi:hypothetical protein
MKKLFVILFLSIPGLAFGQIFGGFLESWVGHSFALPSTCQGGREVTAVTDALKAKMRESGTLAAQVAVGYQGRIVMSCGVGYNDALTRSKLAADSTGKSVIRMESGVTGRAASRTKHYVLAAMKKAGIDTSQNLAAASGLTSFNGVLMSGFATCSIEQAVNERCQIIREFATAEQVEQKTGWKRPFTPEQQLRYELGRIPSFTPGTENYVSSDYSNVGYGLLGAVLERATGKSLIDYVHETVTGPIGVADDEVKVVFGGYQMCSDGKWITIKGVQRCQNLGSVTAGREPGEPWADSLFTFPSEYDGATVYAGNGGAIENSGAAFSFVDTPRAAIKMIFNYNADGSVRSPLSLAGGASKSGNVTGGSSIVARNGGYALYLYFNRESIDPSNGQRINSSVANTLLDIVNGIDWSVYSDLDTDTSSRITMQTYYHAGLDYYFLAGPISAAVLDNVPGWTRQTGAGDSFTAWAPGVKKSVYRYFHEGEKTHFFGTYNDAKSVTRFNPQLPLTQTDGFIGFRYEAIEMSVIQPNISAGTCESGTVPVYRLFRAKSATKSANHRYTTAIATYNAAMANGWAGEGVVFCGAQ